MTHLISDRCIGTTSAACAVVCPVDCIHPREGTVQGQERGFHVDPDVCIDCALCVEVCPVGAIFHPDVPLEAAVPAKDKLRGSCC
jgi:ferredoxin--NADP+ reductase